MSGKRVIGAAILLFGTGLLLDRIDLWDLGDLISTFWPLLLVGFGVLQLLHRSAPPASGWLAIGIGAVLLADRLGFFPEVLSDVLWPLLLIVFGAALVLLRSGARRPADGEDSVRHFVAFGAIEDRNESRSFRGGTITAMFGSVELDLREAALAPEGALLDVTAFCGGVDLQVPRNWKVHVSGAPLLAAVDNKTAPPEDPAAGGAVLEVKCFALMAGVDIKN